MVACSHSPNRQRFPRIPLSASRGKSWLTYLLQCLGQRKDKHTRTHARRQAGGGESMLSMRGLADSPTFIQNTEQADLQTFPSILQVNRRDTSFPFAPSSVPFHASIDDNERVLLKVLMMIGSGLSIIGSFFIILSYFLFKDSRKFSRKILLYLSFADMVASSAWVLQYVVPESAGGTGGGVPANNTRTRTLCETQGYMLEFFYLASYIWTGCFAWHLYQLIDARNRTPRKLEGWYHALSWGIPLIVGAAPVGNFLFVKPSRGICCACTLHYFKLTLCIFDVLFLDHALTTHVLQIDLRISLL